jgi:hypothetical protein
VKDLATVQGSFLQKDVGSANERVLNSGPTGVSVRRIAISNGEIE